MNDKRNDKWVNRSTGETAFIAEIVRQAYDDIVLNGIYIAMAKTGIAEYKHNTQGIINAERIMNEAKSFFGSPWQKTLVNMEGQIFIDKAEKEIVAGVKERVVDWYLTPVKRRKLFIKNAGDDADGIRSEIEKRMEQIESMPDGIDKTIVRMYFAEGKRMQKIMPRIGMPNGSGNKAKREAFGIFFDIFLDGVKDYSVFEIGGKNA